MGDQDNIGSYCEAVFQSVLLRRHPTRGFLFQVASLGAKWPATDFMVELLGADERCLFFAQVKGTNLGYTQRERRLKVQVGVDDIRRLAAYPIPTYLVGVDAESGVAYITSANGENLTGLSSMRTEYLLSDDATKALLWDEVQAFWTPSAPPKLTSIFRDASWR